MKLLLLTSVLLVTAVVQVSAMEKDHYVEWSKKMHQYTEYRPESRSIRRCSRSNRMQDSAIASTTEITSIRTSGQEIKKQVFQLSE